MVRLDDRSVFGKGSKITLGLPIPPHSRYRLLPPTLHLLQRTLVGCVTLCDHLLEMSILRFDDLIRGHAMEWKIARSTPVFTCHGLQSVTSFHCGSAN